MALTYNIQVCARMFTFPLFGLTYLTNPQLLLTFSAALVASVGIEVVNFITRFRGRTTK
ncbi:MAG: hypothetical protein ACOYKO_04830 [Rhodoluna sp.]